MRITTVTGLVLAGAAVAAAVGLGTTAYADTPDHTLIITTEDDPAGISGTAGDSAATRWDCPGNGGGTPPSESTADSL